MKRDDAPENLLRGWSDFLDKQMEFFDRAMEQAGGGRPFKADEVNVTFLELDDELHKSEIEKAVADFAASSGTWPKLTIAQLRLLSLRAFMARGLVLALLSGQADSTRLTPKIPNDVADKRQMIPWLFVHTWNVAGRAGIKALAAWFLRRQA